MNNKVKNKFGCELWIYTDDKPPQTVTSLTGIEYSKIREKGKPWFEYGLNKLIKEKICTENIWIFSREIESDDDSIYLNDAISLLLEAIEANREKLIKIFFDSSFKCQLTSYGYIYDYHIYFILDPLIINKLKEFNLKLDFDIYSFKENA